MTSANISTEKTKLSEEHWNVITHAFGVLLSIPGLIFLILEGMKHGTTIATVSFTIFGISTLLLFLASTVYHASPRKTRRIFRIFDHCSIYLLIAGTYTPFALVAIGGALGWTIFGIEWGFAILGLFFKAFFTGKFKKISLICYLGMGWLIIIAFNPIIEHITREGFFFLLSGGLMYTFGAYFFANEKIPYNHAIWHMFGLFGSAFRYWTIIQYV